jgi:glucokinase
MNVSIGIDVGGTKLAAALVETGTGTVLARARRLTDPQRGAHDVLHDCADLAEEVRGAWHAEDVPIGLGVCELVNPSGQITSAATIDWRDVDIAGAFPGYRRVVVESDVRAAAVAEARFGAARGLHSCVYLTVGTGIAFTLLIEGVPYQGARGNALLLGAPMVEHVASGAALARLGAVATAEEAFDAALGRDAVRRGAEQLGRAMAWLVNALDPEAIVVGGGLGLRDDYRHAWVRRMRELIEVRTTADLEVRPALLGVDAGAIGAALIAL